MSKKIKFCLLLFVAFCVTFATSENVAAIGFLANDYGIFSCVNASGGEQTYTDLHFVDAGTIPTTNTAACKNLTSFRYYTTATLNNSMNNAYWTYIGKVNIVIARGLWQAPMAVPKPIFNTNVRVNSVSLTDQYPGSFTTLPIDDQKVQVYDTLWTRVTNGMTYYYETLTVNFQIYGSSANFFSNKRIRVWFETTDSQPFYNGTYAAWYEKTDVNPTISFNLNEIPGLITNIIGNQTLQMSQEEQERFEASQASDQELDTSSLEGKATSLLGAMSTFVTSLYTLHTTDCIIPQGASVNGLDFSGADLCSYDLPAPISAIASLSLIFIVVPLGFNVCKRLINTVDWVFK